MSGTTAPVYTALQTSAPLQNTNPQAGDAASNGGGNSIAGAAGSDTGSFGQISQGGIIAIVVVISAVITFGIVSAVLFYLAKKRSWEVRASIRRSARRVVTALTPRRSEFPKDVRVSSRGRRGRARLDDVPPTPRLTSYDIEKGNGRMATFELADPKRTTKWGRKTDR